MIAPSTVLVLGAGASKPYGFPLGHELKTEITTSLENTDGPHFNALMKCEFDKEFIVKFQNELHDSIHETIDDFLDSRPTYRRIGSFAIAQSILRHEIDSQLPARGQWYSYLFKVVDFTSPVRSSPVTEIVTLNYDRSLERYLRRTIDASYERDVREAGRRKLKAIPIIHVHGTLGTYPQVPYGRRITQASLPRAADTLRIASDIELDDSPEYERAREAIRQAQNVVFLGFGYHEGILQRLNTGSFAGKHIYGSAFNIDDATRNRIKGMFDGSIELGDGGQEIGNYFYNLKMVSAEQ